jgi:phenylacetate-coenzyme A ligase PaaK-like adenylate-forming protein
VFVFDATAAVQFVTSLTRSLTLRLQAAGVPSGGLTIAMVGAPSAVHATGSAPAWTDGIDLPFRFVGVPATLPVSEVVERLNQLNPPALAGFPTILARLAAERRAGRLHIAPQIVTCTSETLHAELRALIAGGFDASVIDTFGSTEGLVGVTPPDDDVLVFNSDVCITELVDENNRAVTAGTPSAKVLVTNLSNRVQPLIRYEMTDSFIHQPTAAEHGHLRAKVQGRADELLRYDEVDVHPLVVRTVLVKMPEVLDYQVHQTRRGIDVSALTTCTLDERHLQTRLISALDEAGLHDPDVTVRAVATLERNHETGKLRRVFPLQ